MILSPRTPRSACCGERQASACLAGLVPVLLGEALGLPVREKPRVRPAVVAYRQRAVAQVDDLHRVRMTPLQAECVIMVAPMRRRDSARCDLGHLRSTWHLIHDPPLSVRRLFTRNITLTLEAVRMERLLNI